ncbi:hypothetical protein DICVIV_08082 [Dictyocaulus viviparus]|uniref:G-protein coupled receptors family 1 profile domain-containing protein n=1 Tax=Dictyocaulus viviparus TaxID=29172 RepID=A0A0D8XPY7_DICVI|nr:hypothetical protein DICVIV_08082 [Dictyocaulus viviparus]
MTGSYTILNSTLINEFNGIVTNNAINVIIAIISVLSNVILLGIFLGYRVFRGRYALLIQLCCGDLIYSIAIIYMGLESICIYSKALKTFKLPMKNGAICVLDIGLQLKLIVTILWMGVERFVAITFPVFYRLRVDGKPLRYIAAYVSAIIVIIVIGFGLLNASNRNHLMVPVCGRRATFGLLMGVFIYSLSIFCNIMSTVLNAIAYVKARKLMRTNIRREQQQLHTILCYLIISLFSTVLVSVPNTKSLFKLYVNEDRSAISKSLEWMQTLNTGLTLFVSMLLNQELRQHVWRLLSKNRFTKSKTRQPFFIGRFSPVFTQFAWYEL